MAQLDQHDALLHTTYLALLAKNQAWPDALREGEAAVFVAPENPAVTLTVGETRTINLVFGSLVEVDDVEITVDLPPGIELASHPGQHRVTAHATLAGGDSAVPLTLEDKRKHTLRGEVIIHRRDLETINEARVAEGEEPFANPRNAAAGSLGLIDEQENAKRTISVMFYDLVER